MGLHPGDPLPIDSARLDAGALVADIIMKPPETALLKAATARGNPTHRGILMFAGQIRPYAEFYGFADSLARIGWREDEFAAQRSRP